MDNLAPVLDLSLVSREVALRTWLAYHNIHKIELARSLGTQPSTITRIIKGERAPAKYIRLLEEAGIPAELLPRPNGRKPGRPRKAN